MYFLPKYKRGIFNKYRKEMHLSEIILKDINYSFLKWRNFFRNGMQHKNMLFFPHYPSRGSTLYKMANILGYNITNKPKKKIDFAVFWEYLTFREEFEYLESISKDVKVLNLHSRDISKVYVESVQQKIFGYGTFIDPLTFQGVCVKKNDINATHDGEVIQCPIEKTEESFIYQILVDNTDTDNRTKDIRVPVINGTLEFVYIKHRDINVRFKNPISSQPVKIEEALSKDEIEKLNQLCKEMHLEYGELDVLRDNGNGQIYVVDVNNTPQGPPNSTPKKEKAYVLDIMSKKFKEDFL